MIQLYKIVSKKQITVLDDFNVQPFRGDECRDDTLLPLRPAIRMCVLNFTLNFAVATAESLAAVAHHSTVRLLSATLFVATARTATALATTRRPVAVESGCAFLF